MRTLNYARAAAGLAAALALPALAGCCGQEKAATRGTCQEAPPPRCEVNGELVYNLGRGMRSDSRAVSCSWFGDSAASQAQPCSWLGAVFGRFGRGEPAPEGGASPLSGCAPGAGMTQFAVNYAPAAPADNPASALPGDALDIPGVTPAILLVPANGTEPAREMRLDETAAEPKAEAGTEAKAAGEAFLDEPVAAVTVRPAEETAASAPARSAMLGKYEKVPSPDVEDLPPVPPASDLAAAVEAVITAAGAESPEETALPAVELPPSLD